ncbi:hypothetical protein MRX96_018383 [Rhipicephalus microplus]
MKPDLVKYYRHSIDWDDMVDHMQNSFQCCGIGPLAYQDWDRNSHYKCAPSNPSHERCSVPESCCRVTSADVTGVPKFRAQKLLTKPVIR